MKFIQVSSGTKKTFFAFTGVGLCVALFQYASFYILFEWFQGTYLVASSVSFFLTVIVSYLLQRHITFGQSVRSGGGMNNGVCFSLFLFSALAGLLFNGGIMFVGVDVFHNSAYITQVFSMGILAFCNFFVYRFLFT